jgi:small conductance mechanosensitive channel
MRAFGNIYNSQFTIHRSQFTITQGVNFTVSPDYFQTLIDQVIAFIPKLAIALFIFFIALFISSWVYRLTRAALTRRNVDPEVNLLLSRIFRWAIIIFGTFQALAQVNFNLGGFLTGLGIIGFTIGFALQDIAKNFVAGVLLLVQQPFDIGHAIDVNGHAGTVIEILIRSTTIKTWDGRIVIIPNAEVYTGVITNFSKSTQRRVELDVGVAYDSDLERVTEVLQETIGAMEGIIRDDPAPSVYFQTFGDSAINLSIYFWCETSVTSPLVAKDQALKAIKKAFEQASIDIPYPTTTILMEKTRT